MTEPITAEYIAAFINLMSQAKKFLNELELYPRQSSAADSVLLGLLSKSIVQTEAIAVLIPMALKTKPLDCVELALRLN